MGLTDMNAEDRKRKEAEIFGMATKDDALVATTWIIEDARAVRAWFAGQALSRYSAHAFPGDRTAYYLGQARYQQFIERIEALSKPVRDALIAYVSEGVDDYLRAPRFRIDAQLAEKLNLATVTPDVLEQLGLAPLTDQPTNPEGNQTP